MNTGSHILMYGTVLLLGVLIFGASVACYLFGLTAAAAVLLAISIAFVVVAVVKLHREEFEEFQEDS